MTTQTERLSVSSNMEGKDRTVLKSMIALINTNQPRVWHVCPGNRSDLHLQMTQEDGRILVTVFCRTSQNGTQLKFPLNMRHLKYIMDGVSNELALRRLPEKAPSEVTETLAQRLYALIHGRHKHAFILISNEAISVLLDIENGMAYSSDLAGDDLYHELGNGPECRIYALEKMDAEILRSYRLMFNVTLVSFLWNLGLIHRRALLGAHDMQSTRFHQMGTPAFADIGTHPRLPVLIRALTDQVMDANQLKRHSRLPQSEVIAFLNAGMLSGLIRAEVTGVKPRHSDGDSAGSSFFNRLRKKWLSVHRDKFGTPV